MEKYEKEFVKLAKSLRLRLRFEADGTPEVTDRTGVAKLYPWGATHHALYLCGRSGKHLTFLMRRPKEILSSNDPMQMGDRECVLPVLPEEVLSVAKEFSLVKYPGNRNPNQNGLKGL